MRLATLLLLSVLALPLRAQPTPGGCALGTAEADLDVSDVLARVFNTGSLFFGEGSQAVYIIPRATANLPIPQSPIFAASFWIGGKVGGEIRTAAAQYANFEFWPGPLNDDGELPSPADCTPYDRIWRVSREDIARYLSTGEATDDLRDWPADLGASVLDGDGVEGNYDLAAGDQPAVWGSQTAWWVMNDAGNIHEETRSDPLGVEVRVSAFAVALQATTSPLDRATFYRYHITNRSRVPIDTAYVALFMDVDLGDAADDYIGSDTTYGMAFAYNADNNDYVYGIPPAVGVQVLQGPVGLPNGRDDDGDGMADQAGERLGLTASMSFFGGGEPPCTDPSTASGYYNVMQGKWTNGTPMTEGGGGCYTGGDITTFAYPGDPVTGAFWSEEDEDNPPGDRRLVAATGPFRLAPGEEEEIVFGLPFGWGSSALGSVIALRDAAQTLRNAWDYGLVAPTRVEAEGPPPEAPALAVGRPLPNPFSDRLTVRYALPAAMPVRLALYDVLGREVAVPASGVQEPGEREAVLDVSALPAGVYFVRFEVAGERRSFPVVKTR